MSKTLYANYTAIIPVKLNGSRYLICSNAGAYFVTPANILIYHANADWTFGSLLTTSTFQALDFFVQTWPSATGFSDRIIICGHYTSAPAAAFVAYYDIGDDAWSYTTTTNAQWLTEVIYNPGDGDFYITPAYLSTGATWFNTLLKCAPTDLLTVANWVTVSMPATTITAGEPRICIFGSYLYVLFANEYTYEWTFNKFDFGSTWTLISQNTDTNTAPVQDSNPTLWANASMVCVPLLYRTPSPNWQIEYSTDGTTFNTIINLPIPQSTASHENWCGTFPISSNQLLVVNVSDGLAGYIARYNTGGTLIGVIFGVISGPAGGNLMITQDDTNWIVGGLSSFQSVDITVFNTVTSGPFTATFNPDAHPESTSVDGYAQQGTDNTAWATLQAAAGNYALDTGGEGYIGFKSGSTSNWFYLPRSIILFDTHTLPDDAVLVSAVLSLYVDFKEDVNSASPDICIYSSNPASNVALVAADYHTLGTVPFATAIPYASVVVGAYNDFAFNIIGLAAVSLTSISKYGVRNANYDVANSTPPRGGNAKWSDMYFYLADHGSLKPKLVVTYTLEGTTGGLGGVGGKVGRRLLL